jgi:hypothetical protein
MSILYTVQKDVPLRERRSGYSRSWHNLVCHAGLCKIRYPTMAYHHEQDRQGVSDEKFTLFIRYHIVIRMFRPFRRSMGRYTAKY